jgi:hypothetical protein
MDPLLYCGDIATFVPCVEVCEGIGTLLDPLVGDDSYVGVAHCFVVSGHYVCLRDGFVESGVGGLLIFWRSISIQWAADGLAPFKHFHRTSESLLRWSLTVQARSVNSNALCDLFM